MKPTLFIIGAFVLLISAWSTLIVVAMRHTPEQVELVRPASR